MIAPSFAAVMLAAGASSRMGRDKALLPWNGQTFLGATIDRLTPFTQLVIVVAGANSDLLRPKIYAHGASMVINPAPERGQFSSLRIGLQEILNRGRDAAIVALVDRPPAAVLTIKKLMQSINYQPKPQSFEASAAQLKSAWAVIPEYFGKHGHPILITREMIECLLKADPSSTARDVEHAHQDRIEYVAVDDPNVVANVNTPEEFERLQQQLAAQLADKD